MVAEFWTHVDVDRLGGSVVRMLDSSLKGRKFDRRWWHFCPCVLAFATSESIASEKVYSKTRLAFVPFTTRWAVSVLEITANKY